MSFQAGRLRALAVLGAVATTAIVVDQVTKSLALEHLAAGVTVPIVWTLQLRLAFNTGAAFGLGEGSGPFVAAGAAVVLVVVLVAARSVRSLALGAALGAVVGGACGNLIDRFFRDHDGAVVDFIDFQWWPIFNVADMCIVVGGLVAAVLWSGQSSPDPVSPDTEPVADAEEVEGPEQLTLSADSEVEQ